MNILSFCANKYLHMAFVEELKRKSRWDDASIDLIANSNMENLEQVPVDTWARAIELAAIEKPRGNICRWAEKIDELGFRTFVSHCGHEYRNKGNGEYCSACGRRIELVEGEVGPELKLLKTAPNNGFNSTRQ